MRSEERKEQCETALRGEFESACGSGVQTRCPPQPRQRSRRVPSARGGETERRLQAADPGLARTAVRVAGTQGQVGAPGKADGAQLWKGGDRQACKSQLSEPVPPQHPQMPLALSHCLRLALGPYRSGSKLWVEMNLEAGRRKAGEPLRSRGPEWGGEVDPLKGARRQTRRGL